jgi:glycosyltransferase involved in cell wall biosynthesis
MRILVIAQDLRVSGTSEGVVSRSFIVRLRKLYPEAIIDLCYFMGYKHEYDKELLGVNSISEHIIKRTPPLYIKWPNAIYRRLFTKSIYKNYYFGQFKKIIAKIPYENYDKVFIRSSGMEYETILACKDLAILRKAIINFHDPYPFFFDTSSSKALTDREILDFKEMYEVVQLAKACTTPSTLLSKDLQVIYGSCKKFYTLPHQYDAGAFDLSDSSMVRKKEKIISFSYHGGLQFGRNLDILLDAFAELCNENQNIKENVEMVFRLKSSENNRLIQKYSEYENIHILDGLNFSNSANEQAEESDIILILESHLDYSNILLGKAPFVASLNKPVFALLPLECELRKIIKNENDIATSNNQIEIKQKLVKQIEDFSDMGLVNPFEDYFSDENFKIMLDEIISGSKNINEIKKQYL